MENYEERHQKIALPCVRVRTPKAGGSGTVIYSGENEEEGHSTYILTNYHVVANCISISSEWSALLKSERKMDKFEKVDAHFFNYRWGSRSTSGMDIQSDIMAYDKEEDLALVRLRSDECAPAVARLFPRDEEKRLRIGMPVICVGAGLGFPPVQTGGFLSQFGMEIDRREYWLSTAAGIWGNSGGAVFLADTYEFIGVPARMAVAGLLGMDAITHLMFAIPVTRIYQFLEDQRFRFIYDSEFTEASEEEERRSLREDEERKTAMASAG